MPGACLRVLSCLHPTDGYSTVDRRECRARGSDPAGEASEKESLKVSGCGQVSREVVSTGHLERGPGKVWSGAWGGAHLQGSWARRPVWGVALLPREPHVRASLWVQVVKNSHPLGGRGSGTEGASAPSSAWSRLQGSPCHLLCANPASPSPAGSAPPALRPLSHAPRLSPCPADQPSPHSPARTNLLCSASNALLPTTLQPDPGRKAPPPGPSRPAVRLVDAVGDAKPQPVDSWV